MRRVNFLRGIGVQGENQSERTGEMFLRKFFRAVIPLRVLLRLFDGRKKGAHGLICWSPLDGEKLLHRFRVREIAGEAVTGLGGMGDDATRSENLQCLFDGLW